jgi:hypothetical protein
MKLRRRSPHMPEHSLSAFGNPVSNRLTFVSSARGPGAVTAMMLLRANRPRLPPKESNDPRQPCHRQERPKSGAVSAVIPSG